MQPLITSRQNTRVRDLRAALAGRPPSEIAAIEGPTLLNEALAAQARVPGLHVQTVFLREDRHSFAAHLPPGTDVLLLSHDAFNSAAETAHSQGIAALLQKPRQTYQPAPGDLLIVAAGLQDPGNLGTIIRSAVAFNAAAVILAENTVDPWNGKALRASAGAVFRLPLPLWSEHLHASLQSRNIRMLAAVPHTPNVLPAFPAHRADLRSGCALFIGNEGNGLSPAMLARCSDRVTLATPGPTESLNAAVAASLLLYEAFRQRIQP